MRSVQMLVAIAFVSSQVLGQQPGTTICLSVGSTVPSGNSVISADGRYVAFAESGNWELADLRDGSLRSIGSAPQSAVCISAHGEFVVYWDHYIYQIRMRDTRTLVDTAVAFGDHPSISGDGRYVAFDSILSPPGISWGQNVCVRDCVLGTTERLTEFSQGIDCWFPLISPDGTLVAFTVKSRVAVCDRVSHHTRLLARGVAQSISNDDRWLVFSDNFVLYVYDLVTGWVDRVGPAHDGGSISDDGRYVTFGMSTTYGPQVYVKDRWTGTVAHVSRGADGPSYGVTMSGDGRRFAFTSDADNLVPNDTNGCSDVFVRFR